MPGKRRPRTLNPLVLGIDGRRPSLAKLIFSIPLLYDNFHRRLRSRETQRFVKRAMHLLGFIGGNPLAINRREPVRVEQSLAPEIEDFKEIGSAVRLVNRPIGVSRPG